MTFEKLGLIPALLENLSALSYTRPTPVQIQAIPAVLAGRDLMAAAQTGTGKTAGFALPLLQGLAIARAVPPSNTVHALVLVPTRELAEQVHQSFGIYGRGIALRTAVAYGGVSINPQMMRLRKGVDVLVATPGRLLDLHRQNAVKFTQLRTLVLDEADRMLDLGFARELDALLALLPQQRQTLLFSATFSDAVRALAGRLVDRPVMIDASPRNTAAQTVRQWLVTVDKRRKPELFLHLLRRHQWPQVLVFVKTRKAVDQLVAELLQHRIAADAIHGDRPQPARLRALQQFRDGQIRVLVATDVAARGLDIRELPAVCNFDLPIVAEDYIHRIGRTGRAGASGEAVSLVCADEVKQLAAIEALIHQLLPRREEAGFEADHRVPETGSLAGSRKAGKPGKSTRSKSRQPPADPHRSSDGDSPGRGKNRSKQPPAPQSPAAVTPEREPAGTAAGRPLRRRPDLGRKPPR